jgi:hypothetical protein
LLPIGLAVLGVAIFLLALVAFVLVRVRRRLGTWELGLAFGVLLADLPLVVMFVIGGAVAGGTEVWIGVLVGIAGFAAVSGIRALRRRREVAVDSPNDDELMVTAAVELALLDATEGSVRPR